MSGVCVAHSGCVCTPQRCHCTLCCVLLYSRPRRVRCAWYMCVSVHAVWLVCRSRCACVGCACVRARAPSVVRVLLAYVTAWCARARWYRSDTGAVLSILVAAIPELLARFARAVEYVRNGHVLVAIPASSFWATIPQKNDEACNDAGTNGCG